MRTAGAPRALAGKRLPPCHRRLDMRGIDLHRVTGPPEFFGRDDRGAAATERVIDGVARPGVVHDRDLKEADGFLRAVPGDGVVGRAGAAEGVEVRDLPDRRLPPIPAPVARAAHGVPRGLMPPVVVSATEREVRLAPDDVAANGEAGGLQV